MERQHGAIPVEAVGCLQPAEGEAVRCYLILIDVKRQNLLYPIHFLYPVDKFRFHMSIRKAVKLRPMKDVTDIRCDKITDNRDGDHGGDTDEEQRDILRCSFIAFHVPGGQPALISQEGAVKRCECCGTEVGEHGNEKHGRCSHSQQREAAGQVQHGPGYQAGQQHGDQKHDYTDARKESDGSVRFFCGAEYDVLHRQASRTADRKPGGEKCHGYRHGK